MPDLIFDEPRLAVIHDDLDSERGDLDAYMSIARELGARSVLDTGCGTGTGFRIAEVRDAPDRPGRAHVFRATHSRCA